MKKSFVALLGVFCVCDVSADLNIDSPLSFGEIAILNNNTVSTTTITRQGAQISTNQIYIIRSGTPGVYTLSGLPLFTNVSLSVDLPAYSAMPYPGTAQFQINAVDIPNTLNTGNTGTAQFRMGATLSTSGNPAQSYFSGADYTLFLNVNIVY
ncbi:DUF4402 domain-containing protein [Rheinheimera gaetbuli]